MYPRHTVSYYVAARLGWYSQLLLQLTVCYSSDAWKLSISKVDCTYIHTQQWKRTVGTLWWACYYLEALKGLVWFRFSGMFSCPFIGGFVWFLSKREGGGKGMCWIQPHFFFLLEWHQERKVPRWTDRRESKSRKKKQTRTQVWSFEV